MDLTEHSIAHRIFFSILYSVLKAGCTFCAVFLLARYFGSELYGQIGFLIASFMASKELFDFGTSAAFFTFIAQKKRSRFFIGLFISWLGVQLLVQLVIIGLVLPNSWLLNIWRSDDRFLLIGAFLTVFFQSSIWPAVMQIGESQRRSAYVRLVNLWVSILHLVAVYFLIKINFLDSIILFYLIALEFTAASFLMMKRLQLTEIKSYEDRLQNIFKEYVNYCKPLFFYSFVCFLYGFLDAWMLQSFGGNIQQSYYSLAVQMGSVCTLVTASIVNIIWKEVAEASYNGNKVVISQIYERSIKSVFFIGIFFAAILIPWAEETLTLAVGQEYAPGWVSFSIMLIYPAYQAIGQIIGTVLYATGRGRLQVSIGIIFMLLSIPVSYILLALPSEVVPGLGLGSLGLSIKMIMMQAISVNIIFFVLHRRLSLPYIFAFQFYIGIIPILVSFIISFIMKKYFHSFDWKILLFMHCIILSIICYKYFKKFPKIIGFDEINILNFFKKLSENNRR